MPLTEPNSVSLKDVYRLTPGTKFRHDSTRQVYFLLLPERLVKLNQSAATILNLIDGTRDLSMVIAELMKDFGECEQQKVENDVLRFVLECQSKGWLMC